MTLRVGIVGCGNISSIYIENSTRYTDYQVVACADLDYTKALELARKYNVGKPLKLEEIFTSPDIDLILNLTVPHAHSSVSLKAIHNGKHVYTEKPLSISYDEGKRILEAAREKGVIVGSAPDTFLGGSLQLAGKWIEEGLIGRIVGATGNMMSNGPESWHPNPDFYYKVGGGPMFDMGPYYLTALISLLGSVNRVTGMARKTYTERLITNPKRFGELIPVEVPTHVTGILEMANGVITTITTSFDVVGARTPFLEIYGEKGTLSLPDPNQFNHPVLVKRDGEFEWTELKTMGDPYDNLRGIGLADMAKALQNGYQPRASSEMALHVLEIMEGIHRSSELGTHYVMESKCEKPFLKDAN